MKKSKKSIKKKSKKIKIFGGSSNWSNTNNELISNKNNTNLGIPSKPKYSASFKGRKDFQFLKIGKEFLCKIKKTDDKSINFICNLKITEKNFKYNDSIDDNEMIIKGYLKLNLKESKKKLDGKTKNLVSKLIMLNQLDNIKDEFIDISIKLLWEEIFKETNVNNIVNFIFSNFFSDSKYLIINGEKWYYEILI